MARMEHIPAEPEKEIEAAEWSKTDRDRAKLLYKEVQSLGVTVLEMMKLQSETALLLREISTQLKKSNKTLIAILSANENSEAGGVH